MKFILEIDLILLSKKDIVDLFEEQVSLAETNFESNKNVFEIAYQNLKVIISFTNESDDWSAQESNNLYIVFWYLRNKLYPY